MRTINIEDIGPHYATTLNHWRERMYASIDVIKGMGYSDAFIRCGIIIYVIVKERSLSEQLGRSDDYHETYE